MLDTMHVCKDCGQEFVGCKAASFCYDCRRKRVGESAKRRRLCDIGARARWHGDAGKDGAGTGDADSSLRSKASPLGRSE